MRVRVLHAKICIIAYALPGLTARQLLNSSTLLDIARQLDSSTELDTPAHAVSLDLPRRARQLLDSYSTATRQLLDSYSTGSTGKALTAPRQRPRQRLDGASTARQLDSQGSNKNTQSPFHAVHLFPEWAAPTGAVFGRDPHIGHRGARAPDRGPAGAQAARGRRRAGRPVRVHVPG